MSLARKIAYNIVTSSTSKILSTILALVAIGFITRYLGKSGFGNYATVLAFLSFFTAISDLGLYHIATREISRKGADEEKILSNVFTLRLIVSFFVVILSPLLLIFIDYPPEVKRGIIIIAVAFLFSSSYQILNGIFQKNLAMDRVALSELTGKIIQTIAIIIAIKYNLGFDWIVASLFLYMLFVFTVVFLWSRKYIRVHLKFDIDYWKKFIRESYPMGIAAIVSFLYFKIDTLMLSIMKGSEDVGTYNVAYKVIENITFFPAMVSGLVLPIFSYTIFSDRKKFAEVANKVFKFFTIITIPLVIGTLFFSNNIIALIGGSEFNESVPVLKILVFALALIFFGHLFNAILIAGNLQKKMMYVLGFAAFINITLNLFFIPKFSYIAAAVISVITELFVVSATVYLVIKYTQHFFSFAKWNRIFFAAGIMIIVFYFSKDIHFAFSALCGTTVYFSLLWKLNVINTSEIASILNRQSVKEYEEIS